MVIRNSFDMKAFQSRVFRNYKFSVMPEVKKAEIISQGGYLGDKRNSNAGWIFKNIGCLLRKFKRYANARYFAAADFVEREARAEKLLGRQDIRRVLCRQLKERIRPSFFREQIETEVVTVLTTSLLQGQISEELSLGPDVRLFSIMTYQMLSQGLENYCFSEGENAFEVKNPRSVGESADKDAEAYYRRGFAHYEGGDFESALNSYTRVIEIDPKDADAYNNRGLSYRNIGEVDKAAADFTAAIEVNPNYAEAYFNRGLVYKDQDKDELAIADLSEAIRIDPEDAEAYHIRGIVYSARGNNEAAIADFTRAIEISPRYAYAYYGRGSARYDQGQINLAINDFSTAVQIDPNYADAYAARLHLYLATGKRALAKEDELRLRWLNKP